MNIYSTLIASQAIKILLETCDDRLKENEIYKAIPNFIKVQQVTIIRSTFLLYAFKGDKQVCQDYEEPEYITKPTKHDNFQCYTLKVAKTPLNTTQNLQKNLNDALKYRQTALVRQPTTQGGFQDNEFKISQIVDPKIQNDCLLYWQPNTNASHQTGQIKQKIKEFTQHIYVDRTNPESFKLQLIQMIDTFQKQVDQIPACNTKSLAQTAPKVTKQPDSTRQSPLLRNSSPSSAGSTKRKQVQYRIRKTSLDK